MATCIEVGSGGFAAHVFAPCHFAGILAEMRPCNMVMLANLCAPEPRDVAFCLVCAGAIRTIRLAMIDPLHFEARMKIIPSPCLVGVDDAPSGDAPANDGDRLSLMLHDCRHGLATPLAHHHDAAALAILVFAPTPSVGSITLLMRI